MGRGEITQKIRGWKANRKRSRLPVYPEVGGSLFCNGLKVTILGIISQSNGCPIRLRMKPRVPLDLCRWKVYLPYFARQKYD